jgi:hypothetical protein
VLLICKWQSFLRDGGFEKSHYKDGGRGKETVYLLLVFMVTTFALH